MRGMSLRKVSLATESSSPTTRPSPQLTIAVIAIIIVTAGVAFVIRAAPGSGDVSTARPGEAINDLRNQLMQQGGGA